MTWLAVTVVLPALLRAGSQCDYCEENYFGSPETPGGDCRPCDCSNNMDPARPGNCDRTTGECLQCLFNTSGFNCEICAAGYYGDAIERTCQGEPQSACQGGHRAPVREVTERLSGRLQLSG